MSDPNRIGRNARDRRAWQPRSNKWLIAIVVTFAAFMEILDTTIVNVSLTHIAGAMSVSYDDATWSLTSYLVANGVVLTISGWLARVCGRKRYFLICVAMFAVASMLCGLAQNLTELILARTVQGFFGGGLQPTQQAILLDTFGPSQRTRAFGLTAVATVVAPAIGPALGGWITDNYSWPWIFFINIPVSALTFFGVMHLVDDPPWTRAQGLRHIDIVGLSLIALGRGCLQIMMDRGEEEDWFSSHFILAFACLAALGILGAVAWLLYERRLVINIRVLGDRNFAMASILMAAMAFLLYGSVVALPQLAQQVLGYDSTLAGLVLSPGAALLIILIPMVGRLQRIVPTKYVIAAGFFILGSAMFYSHRLAPDVSFNELMIMRAAQAAGLAFLFAPLTTIAFVNISREDNGDASALFTMFRNVSGSMGISLTTALIVDRTQVRMAHLVPHLTPLDQGYMTTLQQYQQALVTQGGHATSTIVQTASGLIYQTFQSQAAILAYTDIFAIGGILAFCVVPIALFLTRTGGESSSTV
jgi:DHA2 family multidrug resistance protein